MVPHVMINAQGSRNQLQIFKPFTVLSPLAWRRYLLNLSPPFGSLPCPGMTPPPSAHARPSATRSLLRSTPTHLCQHHKR